MSEQYERQTFQFRGESPEFICAQLYQAAMAFLRAAKVRHQFKRAAVVVTLHMEA